MILAFIVIWLVALVLLLVASFGVGWLVHWLVPGANK